MHIHTHENIPFSHLEHQVHPNRHNLPRVVEKLHLRLLPHHPFYYPPRAIGGHAFCHQDLKPFLGVILLQHSLQAALDISFFIAYRNLKENKRNHLMSL